MVIGEFMSQSMVKGMGGFGVDIHFFIAMNECQWGKAGLQSIPTAHGLGDTNGDGKYVGGYTRYAIRRFRPGYYLLSNGTIDC